VMGLQPDMKKVSSSSSEDTSMVSTSVWFDDNEDLTGPDVTSGFTDFSGTAKKFSIFLCFSFFLTPRGPRDSLLRWLEVMFKLATVLWLNVTVSLINSFWFYRITVL